MYHAIVWQDTRVASYVEALSKTGGQDRFRAKTGLPLATYFSGLKIRWILEKVPGVRALAESGVPAETRERMYRMWKKAVTRAFDWVEEPGSEQ